MQRTGAYPSRTSQGGASRSNECKHPMPESQRGELIAARVAAPLIDTGHLFRAERRARTLRSAVHSGDNQAVPQLFEPYNR